ncbi:MAG TPA: hypothetical protein DCL77_05130 [Prolixibacteraceae bacterium]|jgi:hypothetical protein|nr:hypothetical protein [Prolixibacteraceae bacterium]
MNIKKGPVANKVYTSCGFQSKLQAQSSLARAVTMNNEAATNSRTLHTLNVSGYFDCNTVSNIQ